LLRDAPLGLESQVGGVDSSRLMRASECGWRFRKLTATSIKCRALA